MGEIIISVVIGACLVASGIAMNVILSREEKRWKDKKFAEASEKGPSQNNVQR